MISRRVRYTPAKLINLVPYIKEVFGSDDKVILDNSKNIVIRETLYYVSGWAIHAARKAATRQKKDTCDNLICFANTVLTDAVDKNSKI